ncbi:hypothetical protein K435DRAFT_812505 [Dendrothele bispora CBS 962.96]|uniref:Uncharacterized protein n=1 Tax=Dendrothele bispora (strain CBS 962.96) TaxID=1314807 RepID=A0A4S8KNX6_DENBC|nr:hypothetical protein K435DRAFT_812505 [Dendrothele bispora CBS 962.96]
MGTFRRKVIEFLKFKPVSGWYFPIGNPDPRVQPAGYSNFGYLNVIILEFGQNLLSNCRNLVLGRINNKNIFVKQYLVPAGFHTGNLAGNPALPVSALSLILNLVHWVYMLLKLFIFSWFQLLSLVGKNPELSKKLDSFKPHEIAPEDGYHR